MRLENAVATVSPALDPRSESLPVPGNKGQLPIEVSRPAAEQVAEKPGKEISEEQVIVAIEKANHKFQYYNTRLEFSIHEQTRQIMVKVYREEDLIREIPPEKILDMVAKMMEWAGLLVDETA